MNDQTTKEIRTTTDQKNEQFGDVEKILDTAAQMEQFDAEVRYLAKYIYQRVNDQNMFPRIAMKVARTIAERSVPKRELDELLDTIEQNHRQLKRPGAYFVNAMKRICQKHEVDWYGRQ